MRHQLYAGVEVQSLRETRRRHALLFEGLPQADLISFRLHLYAQFVPFEGNPSGDRFVQLLLIPLRNG